MSEIRIEERFRIPGGTVVVEYTVIRRGDIPLATVVSQPDEASVRLTRLRDAVKLLQALRDWGQPRHVKTLIDADSGLREVFMPALVLMQGGAAS